MTSTRLTCLLIVLVMAAPGYAQNPMPNAGDKADDATYGTDMIRLTDNTDSSTDCYMGYSNLPAFNRNNTKVGAVCIVGVKRFKVWDWNPETNTRSNPRIQANPPSGYREHAVRWANTVYNRHFSCAGRALYQVDIPNGSSTTWTNTLLKDLSSDIGGTGSDYCEQVSISQDDDVFAMHYVVSGVNTGYLVYKRSTDTVLLNVSDEGTIDEVEIDKSGRYLVVRIASVGTVYVWDLQGTPSRTTVTTEPFVHRAMGNAQVVSACSSNRLCKRDLATPNTVTMILTSGWSYATQQDHLSMPGTSDDWVLSCRYHTNGGSATNPYDNECVRVRTDGSETVQRLLVHHAQVYSSDYDAQPKGALSMDGRYFAWGSNWDGADTSTPNHVYIADLAPPSCLGSSPNRTAVTGSYADVRACVTVASDGDTVYVPDGSWTWTTLLDWTDKSITLKGAGIDQTIIDVDNLNGTYPCLMDVTLKPTGNSPAGFTRITGFTFRATQHCGDDTPNTPDGMIRIKGDSANFRFDHNKVESNTVAGGVVFNGYVRGVVDHNVVTSAVAATLNRKSFVCWHDSWANTGLYGHASWANPSTVGTVDQLIFEDNTFDRTGAPNGLNAYNDDYAGCRATYRFNLNVNSHAATHGTETSEHIRALRHIEYYRNHTTTHPTGQDSVVKYRDGSGMVFDNTTTPNMATARFGALATLRREDDGSHPGGWRPWKSCGEQGTTVSVTRSGSTATFTMSQNHYVPTGGAFVRVVGANQTEYNGTFFAARVDETVFTVTVTGTPATPATGTILVTSPFDNNTDATGYPCLDQVGRGAGVLYTGTGSNMTPTTAANQESQPVYCWGNSVAGTPRGCSAIFGGDVIVENREFYNLNTSYNGTTGIGRGLRSARPATCTAGTAYWSTDGGGNWNTSTTETFSSSPGEDGGLDLCSATNTWTNDWYVPPTYPHPLNVQDSVLPSGPMEIHRYEQGTRYAFIP